MKRSLLVGTLIRIRSSAYSQQMTRLKWQKTVILRVWKLKKILLKDKNAAASKIAVHWGKRSKQRNWKEKS